VRFPYRKTPALLFVTQAIASASQEAAADGATGAHGVSTLTLTTRDALGVN
jgi:hypothetical protein